jgi:hypothetical protein
MTTAIDLSLDFIAIEILKNLSLLISFVLFLIIGIFKPSKMNIVFEKRSEYIKTIGTAMNMKLVAYSSPINGKFIDTR